MTNQNPFIGKKLGDYTVNPHTGKLFLVFSRKGNTLTLKGTATKRVDAMKIREKGDFLLRSDNIKDTIHRWKLQKAKAKNSLAYWSDKLQLAKNLIDTPIAKLTPEQIIEREVAKRNLKFYEGKVKHFRKLANLDVPLIKDLPKEVIKQADWWKKIKAEERAVKKTQEINALF